MSKLSDEWRTPDLLFDELDLEFNFDIDLCANEDNSKCEDFCHDYLKNLIARKESNCIGCFQDETRQGLIKSAFMNPPYSNPRPFIEKAWEDSKYCKIVCLVKCDPSTRWWAIFWNYETTTKTITVNESDFGIGTEKKEIKIKPGPKSGCEVRFFPTRIKFDPPQQLIDSGEVYDLFTPRHLGATAPTFKPKWVQKCNNHSLSDIMKISEDESHALCANCKGKGYKELTGPTFSSALIIMDRRNG